MESKVKLFYSQTLFRAKLKTLNMPLGTVCCIELFKAQLNTSKRLDQVSNADLKTKKISLKVVFVLGFDSSKLQSFNFSLYLKLDPLLASTKRHK